MWPEKGPRQQSARSSTNLILVQGRKFLAYRQRIRGEESIN
jgi:hypothetical protein